MEGVLFCTILFAEVAEHAPEAATGGWLWGLFGSFVGAIASPFFHYLYRRFAVAKQAEKDKVELIFQEGQKLRNELMSEILENRKQVTDLQREHLNCQKENIELKSQQTVSNAAIKALQEENTTLKSQVAAMQIEIKQLKGEEE